MELKILYHGDVKPITKHGDWYDLATADEVRMNRDEFKLISLGVSIELPKGYEAIVAPRSSTFKNYGIMMANSIGIIDNAYCGNNDVWKFPALATRSIMIPKGTRVCQFRLLQNSPSVEVIPVDSLENDDRGGFGSTGA